MARQKNKYGIVLAGTILRNVWKPLRIAAVVACSLVRTSI